MDKINKLIMCHIPVTTCNLRCEYCYITIQEHWKNALPVFDHSPEVIGAAFSQERLGGTCLINMCGGGETLLPLEMPQIIKEILKQGHYIEVVTNGTVTKRFEEISKFPPELLERLTFKFSFHYLELKRLNMIDEYFSNINMMKEAGCSFTVEMTPYDELEPYTDEIKDTCIKKMGGLCHLTIARNDLDKNISVLSKHSLEDYINIWSQFDSEMLRFKSTIFNKKRKEFCYAGLWTANIRIGSGDYSQCYGSPIIGNIYDDLSKPIKFKAIGKCPVAHCYNGHALLTLGVIPEIDSPTYADIRNIKFNDGTQSYKPKMYEFTSGKLINSNNKLSKIDQNKTIAKSTLVFSKWKSIRTVKKFVKGIIK